MKILYYRRQVFYCVAILMMVTLLLLLLILLFVSCKASNDKYLEQCLILAGKNRIEFEKVLNHYKNDPLKKRAIVYGGGLKSAHFCLCIIDEFKEETQFINFNNNV